MNQSRLACALFALLLTVACDPKEPGPDVPAPDAGIEHGDSGTEPDAGTTDPCEAVTCGADAYCHEGACRPRGAALCAPLRCTSDDECGEALDLCIQPSGGRPYCSRACTADSPCPDGYACDLLSPSHASGQCVPVSGSCDSAARPCAPSANDCTGEYDLCAQPPGEEAYCTRPCVDASDCPPALAHCGPDGKGQRVCRKKLDTGATACGVVATPGGHGAPCGGGDTCAAGLSCVAAPALGRSICTAECTRDSDCGADAFCDPLQPGGVKVCVPYNCACAARISPWTTLLQDALGEANRDVCFLGHRFGDLNRIYTDALAHDPQRLTTFDKLYYAPLAIPAFERSLARSLKDAALTTNAVSDVLHVAGELWDAKPAASPTPAKRSFEDALFALHDVPLEGNESLHSELIANSAPLSRELKAALAPLLVAIAESARLRDESLWFIRHDDALLRRYFLNPISFFSNMHPVREPTAHGGKLNLATNATDRDFLERHFDGRKMVQAADVLARAVASSSLRAMPDQGAVSFNWQTPLGRVVISGTGDDRHLASDPALAGDIALFVELGGDDTYEIAAGATTSIHHPVALHLDLGGNDTYGYVEVSAPGDSFNGTTHRRPPADAHGRNAAVPRKSLSEHSRQGAGRLGVGMLFDFGAGDDTYKSLRMSQGFGMFGVGVLFDEGGHDLYQSEALSQGSGHFGVGVLMEGGGNDTYTSYGTSQGGVHLHAVGLLIDYDGQDTYWTSMGNAYVGQPAWITGHDYLYEYGINQGASWGRRADFPQDGIANGRHASGGFGGLFDFGTAKDRYTCGAFCQANGYWFGIGVLHDEGGDDEFDGRIYTGGTGAHFGIGIFTDRGGNDRYSDAAHAMQLNYGFAHDFSLAWHADLGGDDAYVSRFESFGTGAQTSHGLFFNLGGNDSYEMAGERGFGMCVNPSDWRTPSHGRYGLRTVGVFVDSGGTDTYRRTAYFTPEVLGNSARWLHPHLSPGYTVSDGYPMTAPVTYTEPNVLGVGLDLAP